MISKEDINILLKEYDDFFDKQYSNIYGWCSYYHLVVGAKKIWMKSLKFDMSEISKLDLDYSFINTKDKKNQKIQGLIVDSTILWSDWVLDVTKSDPDISIDILYDSRIVNHIFNIKDL